VTSIEFLNHLTLWTSYSELSRKPMILF